MRRYRAGQALLIAVLFTLVLTILTLSMVTLGMLQYDTALIRKQTANTIFHAQSGVRKMVSAIDKGLLNYEPQILEEMKPYILYVANQGAAGAADQVTGEDLDVVARAYAYRWVMNQWFKKDAGGNLDLTAWGQKFLTYTIQGTQVTAGTVPTQLSDNFVNYQEVTTLVKTLERNLKNNQDAEIVQSVRALERAMDKPCFLIDATAVTMDGLEVYNSRQVLGVVRLDVNDPMTVKLLPQYRWRVGEPEVLGYGLLCYGELSDPGGRLQVEGTVRTDPRVGGLAHLVKWTTDLPCEVVTTERIDLANYYVGSDPRPTLLMVQNSGGTTLYSSHFGKNKFRGIIIGLGPLTLQGDLELEGEVIGDQGIAISGGNVKIKGNPQMFWRIQEAGWQRQMIEGGIWQGVTMSQVALGERSAIYVDKRGIWPRLETMKEGRMVDGKVSGGGGK